MGIGGFIQTLVLNGLESIGRYYSNYRGYVIDNEDPEGLNRIKVRLPSITRRNDHPVWAWPKNTFGGQDYGMQVLPLKGDLVWIEFEHGDSRFPLWSHGHYAKDEKPEEFITSQVYGFKSPKGQIIIIDDRDDVEQIIINHGENAGLVKVIELTEKLNNIESTLNDFMARYKTHIHIDPISGQTGVPMPVLGSPDTVTLVPENLIETQQSDIENTKVLH